jgi:class 3 adenylate cyclase
MTLAAWLQEVGLGRYADLFTRHAVDLDVLADLTDGDLKGLGIPLGDRKRLLTAVRARAAAARANGGRATALFAPAGEVERRQLTVLFCDLVGSTALSARLDPEDMSDIIGAYHRACSDTILRHGGYVAKFLGDGLLAYFGYPRASEDDAERAVRAALDLVAVVSRLTTEAGPLRTRVGIATGRVVVGDLIGEGTAREHAVVGETPNLAARLQALATPDQVVVAEATRAILGGLFEFRDLGEHAFKGFDALKRVFTVAGESTPEDRFTGLRASALTPMVGRDAEIGHLLDLWHSAQGGQGQLVLIGGEPGIGKSRLLRGLRERVARDEHTLWALACAPHLGTTPLAPIAARSAWWRSQGVRRPSRRHLAQSGGRSR